MSFIQASSPIVHVFYFTLHTKFRQKAQAQVMCWVDNVTAVACHHYGFWAQVPVFGIKIMYFKVLRVSPVVRALATEREY